VLIECDECRKNVHRNDVNINNVIFVILLAFASIVYSHVKSENLNSINDQRFGFKSISVTEIFNLQSTSFNYFSRAINSWERGFICHVAWRHVSRGRGRFLWTMNLLNSAVWLLIVDRIHTHTINRYIAADWWQKRGKLCNKHFRYRCEMKRVAMKRSLDSLPNPRVVSLSRISRQQFNL